VSRETKYRGKRKDTGEWVYGYYFKSVNDRDYIVSYATEEVVNTTNEIDFLYNEVIPETVGQYTDIKDEESEEIYSGDIISSSFGIPPLPIKSVVEYRESAFMVSTPEYTPKEATLKKLIDCVGGVFVIGNIYENPELLEGE